MAACATFEQERSDVLGKSYGAGSSLPSMEACRERDGHPGVQSAKRAKGKSSQLITDRL